MNNGRKWPSMLRSASETSIEICQTWRKVSVILKTDFSTSKSKIGGIITQDPVGVVFGYEYLNEPTADTVETMQIHKGTASLILKVGNKKETLKGDYYGGRGRQHFGLMSFQRKED
jgi:hypothetical protein